MLHSAEVLQVSYSENRGLGVKSGNYYEQCCRWRYMMIITITATAAAATAATLLLHEVV
jgi:hypothetical protein